MATTPTTKTRRTRKTTTPTTIEKWAGVLSEADTAEAQAETMIGMRTAGASYAQMAVAIGVVPMPALTRCLRVTAS